MAARSAGELLALSVATGRLAIGVAALAAPRLPLTWWVDDADVDRPMSRLLARALGGRDTALALGAVGAVAAGSDVRPWAMAGALADTGDALATGLAWRHLPPSRRRLVLAMATGAAVTSLVAVLLPPADRSGRP